MQNSSVRWLHISDIHAGKDPHGQSLQFARLLNHIDRSNGDLRSPHFVFVTGDIANKGRPEEYQAFLHELIDPMRKRLPNAPILCIPGNHDIDHDAVPFLFRDIVTRKAKALFDPTMAGATERAFLAPRFQAYIDSDPSDFERADSRHWLLSEKGIALHRSTINGMSVAVLGINTAWLSEIDVPGCKIDCDRFAITPGKSLVELGLEALRGADVRIVLGHHPVSWFSERDGAPIKALLGRSGAMYLHGHLHKTGSFTDEGAGYGFRTLQSGALFQAREDERWVNRVVWCEYDPASGALRVWPYHWSLEFQDWVIDGNALPPRYKETNSNSWLLPTLKERDPDNEEQEDDPLFAWRVLDSEFFATLPSPSSQSIEAYFDGSLPSISIAANPSIPRRSIVGSIIEHVDKIATTTFAMTVLVGAAGEGKSTAILQAACLVAARSDTRTVLVLVSTPRGKVADFYEHMAAHGGRWLLCLDDADVHAAFLLDLASLASREGKIELHVVAAARDTDWRASIGDATNRRAIARDFQYLLGSNYVELLLRGLDIEDAKRIVSAWDPSTPRDGALDAEADLEKRAEMLVDAARAEAAKSYTEGSLLGALLRVRHGSELKTHVRNLFTRLKRRPILQGQGATSSQTLADALALIAVMHAENILFLGGDVLAATLGIDPTEVRVGVQLPLGEEAAVEAHGPHSVLLTRHRAVAEALVSCVEEDDRTSSEQLLVSLLQSAEALFRGGAYIPDFYTTWRKLPSHFLNKGRPEVGIRLALRITEFAPHDPSAWMLLANTQLSLKRPDQALDALRRIPESKSVNRRALLAVSNVYRQCDVLTAAAVCTWAAMSDVTDAARPKIVDLKRTLLLICQFLSEAWQRRIDEHVLEAAAASATLYKFIESDVGMHYRIVEALDRIPTRATATYERLPTFRLLRSAMQAVAISCEHQLPVWFTETRAWTFMAVATHLELDYRHGL